MKVTAIGSDHAGFFLKKELMHFLKEKKYTVMDVGAYDQSPVDYPDIAVKVGAAIHEGLSNNGIGQRIGNRFPESRVLGIGTPYPAIEQGQAARS